MVMIKDVLSYWIVRLLVAGADAWWRLAKSVYGVKFGLFLEWLGRGMVTFAPYFVSSRFFFVTAGCLFLIGLIIGVNWV